MEYTWWKKIKVNLLILGLLLSGIGNNWSFFMIVQLMPSYPAFLLYGTTIQYVLVMATLRGVFWLCQFPLPTQETQQKNETKSTKETASRKCLQLHYFGQGVILAVNGVLAQFSDPYVAGTPQSIIPQLVLPLTAVFFCGYLVVRFLNSKESKSRSEGIVPFGMRYTGTYGYSGKKNWLVLAKVVGTIWVFTACIIGILPGKHLTAVQDDCNPDTTKNSPFWLTIFVLSVLPTAIVNVWQDHLFRKYENTNSLDMVLYPNMYTIPFYIFAIVLETTRFGTPGNISWSDASANQRDAFKCALNSLPLPHCCDTGAWAFVLLYCIFYLLYFWLQALIIREESAVFMVVVNGLVSPLAGLVAASSVFVPKASLTHLTIYNVVSLCTMPIGILIYSSVEMLAKKEFSGYEGIN